MAAPELEGFAADLYERLAPWSHADADNGYALALLCQAVGAQWDEIEAVVRTGGDGTIGWVRIMDPDVTPSFALEWLAQWAGVTTLRGISDADQRTRVRSTDGVHRGTRDALIAAAQAHLTGTKLVVLVERDSSPYHFTVATRSSETPDSDAAEAALLAQKPAGLVMDYASVDGEIWPEAAATWAGVDPTLTWDDVLTTSV